MHGRKPSDRVSGPTQYSNRAFQSLVCNATSHAYSRYQIMLTRNDSMQQVAFKCQKLVWAGLHQPAP